ncbi:unnamed protein product [Aphanomyces euteiches]
MTATPNLAIAAVAASALAASAAVALAYKQKKSTRDSLNQLDAAYLEAWEESIEVLRESLLYEDTNALQWERSLEEALGAIVSIRIMQVVSFDGDTPSCTVATGFIVDKERGLILTNRHVVTPGPVVADAIFVNHEEVDLVPIYRDPVHDFGFFRFDPSAVRFLDLHEIPLRPDLARVGTDIRVVGNDNAEKVQILPGVLAKLDRAAPNYGSTGYNDFNTFYFAAASSTSGGSSGSPVLNIDGTAVALNAGGATNAASSYYLPLDRVKRALSFLQDGELHIPRGTWQTIFRHVAFDEGRQLGLTSAIESRFRAAFPQGTGVLVVDQALPGGSGDLHGVQVGDIVVSINGQDVATFLALEEILDSSVGLPVALDVLRGGHSVSLSIPVQDLHSITPRQYLQVGGCILHDLSYQQARNTGLPVGTSGVFVANAGFMFVQANIRSPSVIVSCGNQPTPTLASLVAILAALPHGARLAMQFIVPTNRQVVHTGVISLDRVWFPFQLMERNDHDGLWHPTYFELPSASVPPEAPSAPAASTSLPPSIPPLEHSTGAWATALLASMVYVRVDIPLMIDGVVWTSFDGIGYVVDAEKGYVLVDRATIHVGVGHVVLTIAASLEVRAAIRFLHPYYNIAIVQYNVQDVPAGSVASLPLQSSSLTTETPLQSSSVHVGDVLEFVGLTRTWSVLSQPSKVTKIDRLALPVFSSPHYRAMNVQVWSFDQINTALGGVFADKSSGTVVALWLKFSLGFSSDHSPQVSQYGLPVQWIADIVAWCQDDAIPSTVALLPVEFSTTKVATARAGLGLSAEWTKALEERYKDTRHVLTVQRCVAGTQASDQLSSGDLVLSIDGQLVAKDQDVAAVCADKTQVDMVVLRNKTQMTVPIQVVRFSTMGTTRVIRWCGLVVQDAPLAVLQWGFSQPGVYIAQIYAGTPADNYAVYLQRFLVQVNDTPTPTMDAFAATIRSLRHGDSVRIHTVSLNTRVRMFTMKMEFHYNPTIEYVWSQDTTEWTRTTWIHD